MKRVREVIVSSRLPMLIFLLLALVQGSYFMNAIGPLTIPDADLNANTSYAIATGQIFNHPEHKKDAFQNPVKVQYITGDSRMLSHKGISNELVYTITANPFVRDPQLKAQQSVNRDAATTITVPDTRLHNRSNQYFPLVYLPQAAGIWVALTTGSSPYEVWQAGRISNFVVFLLLMLAAIALIPKAKYFLALAGSVSPTIFIASSLMSDAFFISIAACFLALFFRVSESRGPASQAQMIGLVTLTVLLFYSKLVYVALAMLVLALPSHIFTPKRKAIFTGSSAGIALITYAPWNHWFGGTLANANISQNRHWLLNNPLAELQTITWNVAFLPQKLLALEPMVGEVLLVVGLSWVALLRHLPHESQQQSERLGLWCSRNRYRIVSTVAFLACLYLTYLALSITWNPMPKLDNTSEILGFQGRYLLPLIPLLASVAFPAQSIDSLRVAGHAERPAFETAVESENVTKLL
ncbi:hypothetical protein KIMH_02180 [Bombiscardovia apis]|uniref:DUF2142 domain-containing protein n=1 Tax=Bombiscardovia apis TaxID=2932182 RepID=A0ABM8BB67_9BIFI|nr:DUF2142 domain-containing protein [Bombiscardovia apis]BDR54107.1 hypothetical protein KIMH_02180 [Bombiscardovia apis]